MTDAPRLLDREVRMNCACTGYDGNYRLLPCGAHYWREQAAYLRGVRAALAQTALSERRRDSIVKKLCESADYIDRQEW